MAGDSCDEWAPSQADEDGQTTSWNATDYVKLLEPMRLDIYVLADQPTESLTWYGAYNRTRYNRELELERATLSSVVLASAAVRG